MRISDWSSDVCPSDLVPHHHRILPRRQLRGAGEPAGGDPRLRRRARPGGIAAVRLRTGASARDMARLMDMLGNLALGIGVALTPYNLSFCLIEIGRAHV